MCKIRTTQSGGKLYLQIYSAINTSATMVPRFSDIDDQIADLKDILVDILVDI